MPPKFDPNEIKVGACWAGGRWEAGGGGDEAGGLRWARCGAGGMKRAGRRGGQGPEQGGGEGRRRGADARCCPHSVPALHRRGGWRHLRSGPQDRSSRSGTYRGMGPGGLAGVRGAGHGDGSGEGGRRWPPFPRFRGTGREVAVVMFFVAIMCVFVLVPQEGW